MMVLAQSLKNLITFQFQLIWFKYNKCNIMSRNIQIMARPDKRNSNP